MEQLNNKYTAAQIHHRFSGMRSTYRANASRVSSSVNTGVGKNDVYVPTWPHYDSMKFLDESQPTRSSETSFTIQDSSKCLYRNENREFENVEYILNEDIDHTEQHQLYEQESIQEIEEDINQRENMRTPEIALRKEKGRPTSSKAKRLREDNVIDECLNVLRSINNSDNIQDIPSKQPHERCAQYGQFVSASLKEMKPWNQSRAMADISRVLLKYDNNNPEPDM